MQTLKTTNQELLDLLRGLQETKDVKSSRFAVIAARNLKIISKELEHIDQMAFPSTEFQELSVEAQKLIESEDTKALEKLEEENKEIIDQRKSQLEKVNEELQKEVEVQLHTISEDNLPEDISTEQVLKLMLIVK
jgi:hypothetical protein